MEEKTEETKKDYNEILRGMPESWKKEEEQKLCINDTCEDITEFIPEIEGYKICDSITYFLQLKLKDFEFDEIIPLYIDFVNYGSEDEINCSGVFYALEDFCAIDINLASFESNESSSEKINDFNHTLLHEIGHYIDFLKEYKKYRYNNETPQNFFDRTTAKKAIIRKSLSKSDFSHYIFSANIDELEADQFYFENINLYERIYNFEWGFRGTDLKFGKLHRRYNDPNQLSFDF